MIIKLQILVKHRDLLEYNLNQNGYNTVTANDGLDAFLKLDPQISLILLDVMMPKVDGYEVCEKIRSNSQFSHIPIVFLTAKNTSEDEYEGLIRGASITTGTSACSMMI